MSVSYWIRYWDTSRNLYADISSEFHIARAWNGAWSSTDVSWRYCITWCVHDGRPLAAYTIYPGWIETQTRPWHESEVRLVNVLLTYLQFLDKVFKGMFSSFIVLIFQFLIASKSSLIYQIIDFTGNFDVSCTFKHVLVSTFHLRLKPV